MNLPTEAAKEFHDKGLVYLETTAPQFCKEALELASAEWTGLFFLGLVLVLFALWWHQYIRKEAKEDRNWNEENFDNFKCVVKHIIAYIMMIGGILLASLTAKIMLTLWIAPRIYLFELFTGQ